MKLKLTAIVSIAFTVITLCSCKKEELFNKPPVANAGLDRVIIHELYNYKYTLHGSGKDSDGKIVGYLWSIVSVPKGSTIPFVGQENASPDVVVSPVVLGDYILQLMVIDDDGAVGVDTVKVSFKSNK